MVKKPLIFKYKITFIILNCFGLIKQYRVIFQYLHKNHNWWATLTCLTVKRKYFPMFLTKEKIVKFNDTYMDQKC